MEGILWDWNQWHRRIFNLRVSNWCPKKRKTFLSLFFDLTQNMQWDFKKGDSKCIKCNSATMQCFLFSSYSSSLKFETSCYIFTFKKYKVQQIVAKFRLHSIYTSPHRVEAIAHVVQIAPKTGFNGCSCILNSFFFPLTATVPLRDWAQNRADLHDQRRRDLSCEAGSGRLRARWGHIHLGYHHQ